MTRRTLLVGALLLAVALAYLPSLGNDFVVWDDPVYVTANPLVTRLSWDSVREIFTTYLSGNYHPLPLLSYAVEYALFGPVPLPFHAVNLLLHLLVVWLAFLVVMAIDGRFETALVAALIFGIHPMRVESVAWVSDRKDLLMAAFFLASLLAYAARTRTGSRFLMPLSFCLFVGACLSKGTAVVLPAILLLVDRAMGRSVGRKSLVALTPFLAAAAFFSALAFHARASYEGVLAEGSYTLFHRFYHGAWRLFFYYLARFFQPFAPTHRLYPDVPVAGEMPAAAILLLVLLAGLGGLLWLAWRRSPRAFFGAAFFLVAILPALAVVVYGYTADRFSYLPSIGLAYLVAHLWSAGRRAAPFRKPPGAVALVAGGCCLVLVLSVLTWRRTFVWRDSVSLWSDAIESFPDRPGTRSNRAHAFHDRGRALVRAGRPAEALEDFNEAIRLLPEEPEGYVLRAELYRGMGQDDLAAADFNRAQALGL
jgi:tetratricopeptide (TPR) repeat protein